MILGRLEKLVSRNIKGQTVFKYRKIRHNGIRRSYMNKNIFVKIRGKHTEYSTERSQKDDEVIEVITQATCLEKDGLLYLFFEENLEGGGVTNHKIIIDPHTSVEIIKKGALKSEMFFKEDCKVHCVYQTPYIELNMDIRTTDIRWKVLEESVHVKIEYLMFLDETLHSIGHVELLATETMML